MHRFLAIGVSATLALMLSAQAAAWSWPADGAVLRPYALGSDAYAAGQHRGIDVAGPDGSPVKAPASGVVTFAGSLPTYGRGLTILTADGYAVTLVHLGSVDVAKGDSVSEGAAVGTVGASGTAEQNVPSIHLGIRRAAEEEGYVDPLGLLPPREVPTPPATPEPVPAAVPASAAAVVHSPAPPEPPATTAETAETAVAAVAESPATSVAQAPAVAEVGPPPAPGPEAQASEIAPQPAESPAIRSDPQAGVTIDGHTAAATRVAPMTTGPDTSGTSAATATFRVDTPVAATAASVSNHAVPANGSSNRPDAAIAGRRERRWQHAVSATAEPPAVPRRIVHVTHSRPRASVAVSRPRSVESGPTPRRAGPRPEPRPIGGSLPTPVHPRTAHVGPKMRRAGSAGSASRATAHVGLPTIAVALVLVALLAVAMGRRAARRIGMDGAVLRHHADLLRQLDAAHRPRLHDRRRGRLRPPSAAART